LACYAFLLTSIDAITGEIGFQIDGPRQVHDERGRSRPGQHGGNEVLRRSRRKSVKGRDGDGLGVVGLDFISIHGNNAADDVNVTFPKLDRKSTRLNSSHLGISYAVFCLKKKKKNEPIDYAISEFNS